MRINGWQIYLVWLAAASVVTFILYGYDKAQAKRNGRRVPEKYLHWLAFLGIFLSVLVISTVMHLVLAGWLFFK